jgi:uncharacterized membrane protein YfcA
MVPEPVLYASAGLLVGVMVGFTGVGGGSLMTPILVLGFGQPASIAVGTDLVFAAFTKLAATLSYGYTKRVDWRVVGRLAVGSLPGATAVILWLWTTHRAQPIVDRLVLHWLAIMLFTTAIGLLLQNRLQQLSTRVPEATLARIERHKRALTIILGVLLGVAVTLTSVGAGAMGVVALLYLYPVRLTADRLVATDIAHALPVTIIGGLGHAALGHVDATILGYLLLGSIPGVFIASRTNIHLPQTLTRVLIAIMLMIVGGRMLLA